MKADVVIIGGGLSGVVAALAAHEKGAKVKLVRKAYGRTALGNGTMSFAAQENDGQKNTLKSRMAIAAKNELLPYSVIKDPLKSMKQAYKQLAGHLSGGFEREIDDDTPVMLCLSEGGALLRSDMAVPQIKSGDLARYVGDGVKIAVIGFAELPFFRPKLLKEQWLMDIKEAGIEKAEIRVFSLPMLDDGKLPFFRMYSEAARVIDAMDALGPLAERIRDEIKGYKADLLLLPPMMGLARRDAVRDISELIGLPCAEVAGGHQAVAGLRLQQLLDEALQTAGVEIINGEAVGFEIKDGRITKLAVKSGGEKADIEAAAYVLAAGRFIGGGLREARGISEPLFGLPVMYAEKNIAGLPAIKLVERDYAAKHVIFSCGIDVNERMQPLDEKREVKAANLYACGDIIGGYDLVLDGCAEGVALASAYIAGANAAGGDK